MLVTPTGDLTLSIAKLGDLAGGKLIIVEPLGKIRTTTGRVNTVVPGSKYKLKT